MCIRDSNGVVYTVGDGNLIDNDDGTWDLTIPLANALAEGNYDVVAMVVDAALNASTDPSSEELEIDLTAPVAPTVTAQLTSSETPVISGTASTGTGETLSVEVNGVTYTVGDGHLVDNGDGTWDLTIPMGDALPEGLFDVMVTVTDAAGNSSSESSTNELTIDLTPPSVPTITSLLTNSNTPTLSGTAILAAGDALSIEVNSVVYTVGDGNLIDNGDGSWDLTIPAGNVLDGSTYDVVASVSDAAGNVSSDTTSNEPVSYTHLTLPTIYSV